MLLLLFPQSQMSVVQWILEELSLHKLKNHVRLRSHTDRHQLNHSKTNASIFHSFFFFFLIKTSCHKTNFQRTSMKWDKKEKSFTSPYFAIFRQQQGLFNLLNCCPTIIIVYSKEILRTGRKCISERQICFHTFFHFKLVWCQIWISCNIIYSPCRNVNWQHVLSFC